MSKTTFEGCVYYACNDPEELCLESPEEAIVERWILHDTKCPLARESIPEMTVKGYVRDEIDIESESESCAETAVERFDEYLSDEYGDPNGDHKAISKESREVLVSELTAAFAKALKSVTVWRCSIAASRTYSPTEVEAILRAEMPEWFEVSE